MDFTLSNAPEYVIKNIDNLQQVWLRRCDAIENNQKGSYSRYLLLILHDLREEIQNNKNRFSQNAYGKKFFKIQFSSYCSFKKEQLDDIDKIRKVWTRERPKIDGKYIKKNEILSITVEDNSDYCVAVDIRGVDSKFMKIKAQQMAERTIAVLSTRNRKDQAIILSSDWVICDSQGEIRAFNFKGRDKPQTIRYNSIDSQNSQQRLGQWISSEDICHPTVVKWLASIDWYRRATEASQSSEEILNSWFAVEKFSDDSKTISKKLPELSDSLKNKKKILKENIDLWLDSEGIRTVQLLLTLSELKFNLYHEVRQVGRVFTTPLTFSEMDISKSIDQDLQDYLSANKDKIDFLEKFIQKVPEIKKQLNSKNIVLPDLNQVNEIFYNNNYCEKYLIEKIIDLKDDVYNIYRISNMLVHSSSTTSRLFDYYAKRSREYCHSLLDAIAYKIYQTYNDDEIMPLESYFREMVIDTNIALEAVKDNKMDKFINWALS
ncbi:hypothetical protein [Nostoc sp. GT001]|uniref:hypothetical protein n=1 Tax=Nostoc sp. GT001 TaxID=3056647 RepID=UPI0025AB0D7E|nr:hypothetical protein [Nostoc sp. GT001]MDM9583305.1 hypothetical protein [Nostoc sp. GT001]